MQTDDQQGIPTQILMRYPRHIRILQIVKFLLIPAVIGTYLILESDALQSPWDVVFLGAFSTVALGIIIIERVVRRRYERRASQSQSAESTVATAPSDA